MKEKKIKVLKVEPGKAPESVCLVNELSALQEAVSIGADYVGLIEIVELDANTCILCNEEGKLIGLTPNRRFFDDILCGTFYVTGQTKHGDLASLSEGAMKAFAEHFAVPDVIDPQEVENTLIAKFMTY